MTDNNHNKSTSKKRGVGCIMSLDERTPRRLKFMEPDLTIVVGGVEFYHYKALLGASCPFFESVLSTDMKEANESRIEFPDKDPTQWLNIYNLLDPSVDSKEGMKDILQSIGSHQLDDLMELFSWFDFLGLETLAKQYDQMIASDVHSKLLSEATYANYECWIKCKDLPCPRFQKVTKETVKHAMISNVFAISRGRHEPRDMDEEFKDYLTDEDCGDEMWHFLLSKVEFPDSLLQDFDRESIVRMPSFWHMVEACSKNIKKPGSFKVSI